MKALLSQERTAVRERPKMFPTKEVCVSDWDLDLNFQAFLYSL